MIGDPGDVAPVGVHDEHLEIPIRLLLNAMRVPPGDQLGRVSMPGCAVSRVCPLPSGFMR